MATVRNQAVGSAAGAFYDLEHAREGYRYMGQLPNGIEEDAFAVFELSSRLLLKAGRSSRALLTLIAQEQNQRAEKWADSQRCYGLVSL